MDRHGIYKLMLILFTVIVASFVPDLYACDVSTTIEKLIQNAGPRIKEEVIVKGYVDRYEEGLSSTTWDYYFQGEFGGEIRVTAKETRPPVKTWWCVNALVSYDATLKEIYLVEYSRTSLSDDFVPDDDLWPDEGEGEVFVGTTEIIINEDEFNSGDEIEEGLFQKYRMQIVLLLVFIVLVIALCVVLMLQQSARKRKHAAIAVPSADFSFPVTTDEKPTDEKTGEYPPPQSDATAPYQSELETRPYFRIPGKLIVLEGPAVDKEFSLSGVQDVDGTFSIIIGRSEVPKGKEHTRIQITKNSKYISRDHAKLVYSEPEKTLHLQNLSKKSSTVVNGESIKPDETVQLRTGDGIKLGDISLQYRQ